jgi:hypothetical protein
MTMRSALERVIGAASLMLILAVMSSTGCGSAVSAGPAFPQVEMDDVRQLEASIEQQMGVMSSGAECVDRCRASSSICDSAARLCQVARDLAEYEALESCRRAETSCHEARRLVREECDCP